MASDMDPSTPRRALPDPALFVQPQQVPVPSLRKLGPPHPENPYHSNIQLLMENALDRGGWVGLTSVIYETSLAEKQASPTDKLWAT